jgi:hypothetical protein
VADYQIRPMPSQDSQGSQDSQPSQPSLAATFVYFGCKQPLDDIVNLQIYEQTIAAFQ